MEDKNFNNLVLLGLSNIQYMLAQMISNHDVTMTIKQECIQQYNNYRDNVKKYVNID